MYSKLLCFPQRETHMADSSACESDILFGQPHDLLEKYCRFTTIEKFLYNKTRGQFTFYLSENAYTY